MSKKKTKRRAKKKQPPRRLSGKLSGADAQRLGFVCADLAEADAAFAGVPNLANHFKRHPKIEAAFRRGQFLRALKQFAGVVATVSEAAHKLGLASGEALREILDTDAEAADIWNKTRLDTIVAARQALLDAAKDGNQTAIRTVENYLREEKQAAGPAADLNHLSQKEICELFGVSRVTLNDWEKKNQLPRNSDKTYNVSEMIQWYLQFARSRVSGRTESSDKLRDLKAEKMELELAESRGRLLDRDGVIAGFVARWQLIIGAFKYKRRELASTVHGQTVERIDDCLARFFEDLQREWLTVPEFLKLPADAEGKFIELLRMLGGDENTEHRTQNTE